MNMLRWIMNAWRTFILPGNGCAAISNTINWVTLILASVKIRRKLVRPIYFQMEHSALQKNGIQKQAMLAHIDFTWNELKRREEAGEE